MSESITYSKKQFMSFSECKFFKILYSLLKDDFYIFSKVKILDIISQQGLSSEDLWKNPIWTNHIDFVVCDKINIDPILAIELNGKEHYEAYYSIKKGFAKDSYFNSIGLPLIVFENSDIDNKQKIENVIFDYLDKK